VRTSKRHSRAYKHVARAIAQEIGVAPGPEEVAGLTKASVVNPEAYDYCLRGNACAEQSAQDRNIRAAIQSYEKAVALDPNPGLACAALSAALAGLRCNHYASNPDQRASDSRFFVYAHHLASSVPNQRR